MRGGVPRCSTRATTRRPGRIVGAPRAVRRGDPARPGCSSELMPDAPAVARAACPDAAAPTRGRAGAAPAAEATWCGSRTRIARAVDPRGDRGGAARSSTGRLRVRPGGRVPARGGDRGACTTGDDAADDRLAADPRAVRSAPAGPRRPPWSTSTGRWPWRRSRVPRPGSRAIDALGTDPAMAEYRYFHATRADFLRRLERWGEAAEAYGSGARADRERARARVPRRPPGGGRRAGVRRDRPPADRPSFKRRGPAILFASTAAQAVGRRSFQVAGRGS